MVSEDIPHPQLGGLGKHALSLAVELHRRGHEVDMLGNGQHPIEMHPDQAGTGRFFGEINGFARGWKQQALGVFHSFAMQRNASTVAKAIIAHSPGYDVVHYHGHLPWMANMLPPGLPFLQTRHDQGGDCVLRTRFLRSGTRCFSSDPADCAKCAAVAPNALQKAVTTTSVRAMRRRTAAAFERYPVVFVSQFLQDGFARIDHGRSHGQVIHNGIDLQLLSSHGAPAAVPNVEAGITTLFSGGALFAYKGYGPLLDALARHPLPAHMQLLIAGDGPEMPDLQRKAGALGRVRLLGWQTHSMVLAQIRQADAVVVPSECDEAFSFSVLEALAIGRQVFSLRRGGIPELERYSSFGQLQLFDTIDALVQALAAAPSAGTPPRFLNERFEATIDVMTDRVLEVYARLVRSGI